MDVSQRLLPPGPVQTFHSLYPDQDQPQVIQRFTIFLTDEDESDLRIEESEEDEIPSKDQEKAIGRRRAQVSIRKTDDKTKIIRKGRRKKNANVNVVLEESGVAEVKAGLQKKKKSWYPCQHCAYASSWKTNLEKHVMAQHTGERPWHCPLCEYASVHQVQLEKHVQSHHLQQTDGQLTCPACPFTTSQIEAFCKHASCAHPSEQRGAVHCGECGKRAVSLTALEMHLLDRHHKSSGSMRFPCPRCDYKAALEENLRSHLDALHRCSDCGFHSDSLREVRRHKKKALRSHHLPMEGVEVPSRPTVVEGQ